MSVVDHERAWAAGHRGSRPASRGRESVRTDPLRRSGSPGVQPDRTRSAIGRRCQPAVATARPRQRARAAARAAGRATPKGISRSSCPARAARTTIGSSRPSWLAARSSLVFPDAGPSIEQHRSSAVHEVTRGQSRRVVELDAHARAVAPRLGDPANGLDHYGARSCIPDVVGAVEATCVPGATARTGGSSAASAADP